MAPDPKSLRRRSLLPQPSKPDSRLPLPSPTRSSSPQRPPSSTLNALSQRAGSGLEYDTMMPPPRKIRPNGSSQAPSTNIGRRSSIIDSRPKGPTSSRQEVQQRGPSRSSSVNSHMPALSSQMVVQKNDKPNSSSIRKTPSLRLKSQKPGFTTYQQHFSPQKKPGNRRQPLIKHHGSSGHHAPPSDRESSPQTQSRGSSPSWEHDSPSAANGRRSRQDFEKVVQEQQRELMYLHLLHRHAHGIEREWRSSAHARLQAQFLELTARHQELKEISHEQQTLLNQLALVDWCQGVATSVGVSENIGMLSRIISELDTLCTVPKYISSRQGEHMKGDQGFESDVANGVSGKYARIIHIFEQWVHHAQQVREARAASEASLSHGHSATKDLAFVEGIGDGWKAEAMVLERELGYYEREFSTFGDVRSESSLGRLLKLYQTLIKNLLQELDLVQSIECQIMTEETIWMENQVSEIERGVVNGIL